MVLLCQINDTNTTGLLFRINKNIRNNNIPIDENNVHFITS